MTSPTSNNEAVARGICSQQVARHGGCGAKLATYVDHHWHCVAAELEAGLIDDAGDQLPTYDLNKGLEAYRGWCCRHPESKL
jgi:hypothetical protein